MPPTCSTTPSTGMRTRATDGCAGSPGCTPRPPTDPLVVVVVDEIAALTAYVTDRET